MAHFAQIDENNVVTQVLVVDNDKLIIDEVESEQAGINFLASLGLGSNWIQTSYNGKFRNRFAGIGDVYNKEHNVFVEPERPDEDIDASWFGLKQPTSPSIMLDSAPRSANRWFNAAVHQAFPQAFQRWGYLHQHNAKTYENAIGKFDVVATTVRNPLDSLASNIVAFNVTDESDIVKEIQATTNILKAIFANKSNITVFKFEDVTTDTANVLSDIGLLLGVAPEPFDEAALKEQLKPNDAGFYSIPKDNQSELDAAKAILNQPQFGVYMGEAFMAYEGIIA
jgi:hypothetical protein